MLLRIAFFSSIFQCQCFLLIGAEDAAENVADISSGRAMDIVRQQMQQEFKTVMREKFLSGEDTHFDYR